MATIQIRNVSEEDYAALRDAAKRAGKSLQSYMLDEASELARRATKRAAFDALAEAMKDDQGSGVTTDDIIDALDETRGPWPGDEERPRGA